MGYAKEKIEQLVAGHARLEGDVGHLKIDVGNLKGKSKKHSGDVSDGATPDKHASAPSSHVCAWSLLTRVCVPQIKDLNKGLEDFRGEVQKKQAAVQAELISVKGALATLRRDRQVGATPTAHAHSHEFDCAMALHPHSHPPSAQADRDKILELQVTHKAMAAKVKRCGAYVGKLSAAHKRLETQLADLNARVEMTKVGLAALSNASRTITETVEQYGEALRDQQAALTSVESSLDALREGTAAD